MTFLMLQTDVAPDDYRKHPELVGRVREQGHSVTAQVAGRPFGVLLGLTARHPFMVCPSYAPLMEVSLDERITNAFADVDVGAAYLSEVRDDLISQAPLFLTDEQEQFRKVVRDFADHEIAPHAEAWDRDHAFPTDVVLNEEGFVELDEANGAFFAAGCSADALDVNRAVQSATASALRAIQVVNKVARAEG